LNEGVMRNRTNILSGLAIAVAALMLTVPATAWQAARSNYASLVTRGENGSHILGNPYAPTKLTEYVSYTCPHCAHFTAETSALMRSRYVAPGTVSVEIRHIVRDPIDMAMAAAANCGAPARFFSRHEALMAQQSAILARVQALPNATLQAWGQGEATTRLRRVADDSGVTDWMRLRGFTPAQVNTCLADVALQNRLIAMGNAGTAAGVTGTPNFAINGALLPGVYSWAALSGPLAAAVARR
ncbi:MAG: thioredoxin domain-containing protein, partial [Sphingopyxis sp.]